MAASPKIEHVGWVERSDTHYLLFYGPMGFAKGSTHPTDASQDERDKAGKIEESSVSHLVARAARPDHQIAF
jgi:hypothetical protein